MRRAALLLLLAIGAPQERAEWTVMVYFDADNDLEAPMMDDLTEMLQVGSTPQVQVIALVDRHPRSGPAGIYTNAAVANLADWTTAKLLRVEKGKLVELEDWGEADMGDPATLTKFIRAATKACPAKRTALILGDHGSGWAGICSDESSKDDMLTLAELCGSLKESGATFDLLGFDACLMATLEVAASVAPYAKVMAASEEEEPAYGWNWSGLLAALTAKPSMEGPELAAVAGDSIRDFYATSADEEVKHEGYGFTFSAISLAKIDAVSKAVAATAQSLQKRASDGRAAWLPLAKVRAATEEYGRDPSEGSSYLLDLVHLGQLAKDDALVAAVRAAVIHSVHGRLKPNAAGLAVFFPPTKEALDDEELGKYADTDFARGHACTRFLAAYVAEAAKDKDAPEIQELAASAATLGAKASITISSKVAADDLEQARFALSIKEGDERVIIGERPTAVKEGRLAESWDGRWFTLETKENRFVCPITEMQTLDEKAGLCTAEIPAQAQMGGETRWRDVTLSFDITIANDKVSSRFLYATRSTRYGQVSIKLTKGDKLRAVYVKIDADGNEKTKVSKKKENQLVIGELKDLVVGYRRLEPGTYSVGFTTTDFAQNTNEDYVDIKIE